MTGYEMATTDCLGWWDFLPAAFACFCYTNHASHVEPSSKKDWAHDFSAKAFDNYLAKEGCLEDPFAKQILRNYQPCVSTPRTPEQNKERVNQQNTVYHKSCPISLSCNFGGTSHLQL